VSKVQADAGPAAITERIAELGLSLRLEKTHVVHCKDDKRRGSNEQP
jgi:hypothetical protein